jgi:hypothetical protein
LVFRNCRVKVFGTGFPKDYNLTQPQSVRQSIRFDRLIVPEKKRNRTDHVENNGAAATRPPPTRSPLRIPFLSFFYELL